MPAVMAVQKRFFGGSLVGAAWSWLSDRVATLITGEKNDDDNEGDGGATPLEGLGFSPVDQVPADQPLASFYKSFMLQLAMLRLLYSTGATY
jgi:hypothetical protein